MRRKHLRIIGLCLFLVVVLGAGCKKKPAPAPLPPPPPLPAAAPAATLSANPTSIERGQASTLEWSSKEATELTLEPDIGSVAASVILFVWFWPVLTAAPLTEAGFKLRYWFTSWA